MATAAHIDLAPVSPVRTAAHRIGACVLLSLRRLALTRAMAAVVGLGALPVAICLLLAIHRPLGGLAEVHDVYEGFLRILYLHFIVFFSANILGFTIMRGEFDDRTLHYLLLRPLRRWELVTGKFLAFLVLCGVAAGASLALTYLALTLPGPGVREAVADLLGAGRLAILAREWAVLVLGLVVYGTFAMLMGGLFRSGMFGIVLLGWESALPYLPSALKLWTAMHYLQSLLPERPHGQRRLFELLGEPAPAALSIGVLVGLTALFLVLSIALFYFRQCQYGEN